jgi:hypothetical protein
LAQRPISRSVRAALEFTDLEELERDLARTALENALEAILLPWFTGQARLDYQAGGG